MKRWRRAASFLICVVLLLQLLPAAIPTTALAAAVENRGAFNIDGLWLTEIYTNDVDRSSTNDSRNANGQIPIKLYNTTADLMEFVEVSNTHDTDIKLNDVYEIYYNSTKMTVTYMNGSSDVTLKAGQTAVLWNYRTDVSAVLPTEAEFRKEMRVNADAVVLKAVIGGGWDSSAAFSVKTKSGGKTVSTFSVVNGDHASDGFSVELQLPLMGSTMEVSRKMNIPSAGQVYSAQVRGLNGQAKMDAATAGKGVYITEIRPNDVNRKGTYGTDDDYMECLEITNTTDRAIDLNKEYQLVFFVKEGARKVLPIYKYSTSASGNIGSSTGCTVPAGGSAVIWCFRKSFLSGYSKFPTEAEFRSAYGISSKVPVYIFKNQNGLSNTNRGFELYSLNTDGSRQAVVSSYCYLGGDDCPDNTSAVLKINPEGPQMMLYGAKGTTTMGTVDAEQLKYVYDNGEFIELRLHDGVTVPSSIRQGEDLRVNFYYEFSSKMARLDTCIYYRFNGTGDWIRNTEGGIRVPNTYEAIISADQLFDQKYVEFYIIATNPYRDSVCGMYKVQIDKLNKVSGIRSNIADGQVLKGTVAITANDGSASNANTQIYIDGVKKTTTPMMETGAYFSFYAEGRDAGFYNSITTTGNKIIANISNWQYHNTTGQVIHIDNQYFTYQSGNWKTTLRFWSGTFGAPVDEYLTPSANREDFTVTNMKLKLSNDKQYLPASIGPSSYNGVDTSAKTNLSTAYDALHKVGDSSKMCPYMDVSFSVPASAVNAVGLTLNTTTLANGTHTLKVTNGTSTKTVSFVVDNAKPSVNFGFNAGAVLSGQITLDPKISDVTALTALEVRLDGTKIQTPYKTTAYALGVGEHTLQVCATDSAGNKTDLSRSFVINRISAAVDDAGTANVTQDSAELYLTAGTCSGGKVSFYQAQKIDNVQTHQANGIVPYLQYTVDVGNASDDDQVVVSWSGTATGKTDAYATNMFVRNVTTGTWEKIATADAKGAIAETAFPVKDHVSNGKATVVVQCTADSALPDLDTATDGKVGNNSGWTGNSRPADYDFAFAWITDTQGYTQRYDHHFDQMNQWIVDNAEDWKIKYVMHTGDLIDDWDWEYQWLNADRSMKIFDEAGMPYGVLAGNHDVASTVDDRGPYCKYFGEDRVKDQPTFGGSYKNNYGHYDLVSQNGQDFIIVYMSWNIYQEEIDWMNEVLAKYSDRKAILCFHAYTHVSNSVDGLLDYYGVMIQKYVVKPNPNVIAVLNGHYFGSTYQTVRFDDNGDGKKDRTVYQICTDYQAMAQGGMQYIKFLYFDLDNDKIYINSYSPYYEDFNHYDTAKADDLAVLAAANSTGVVKNTDIDSLVLTVDFNTSRQTIRENSFNAYLGTSEVLGTATLDASGKARITASALDPETKYSWYAVADRPDGGKLITPAFDFTTDADSGSRSASVVQDAKLVRVGTLQTGVPYVITEKNSGAALTGTMVYTTSADYKGLNKIEGLKTVDTVDLNNAPVWYYDGTHLLYGTNVGTNNYLVYNSSYQVSLGSAKETNIIDKVTVYNAANKTFNLYPSKLAATTNNCYLNQLGGSGYNAVGLYTSAYYSQWYFDQLLPRRKVTLTVSAPSQILREGTAAVLTPAVKQDGAAVQNYVLTYSVDHSDVASVSADGTVTALKTGQVTVTAKVTSVNGRGLDTPLSASYPLTVTANTVSASGTQQPVLVPVGTLQTGVAYVITEKNTGAALTGTMAYTTSAGYKGLNGLQGLKTVDTVDLNNAPVWYYDGTHLLYGTNVGTNNYLVYNSSKQVSLGSAKETNIFDQVAVYSQANKTFTIRSSQVAATTNACYLNQMGGSKYNVVGLYQHASTSQWYFNQLLPQRKVNLTLTPGNAVLAAGETLTLDALVTVDGTKVDGYTLNFTSSDETVALVNSVGTVTAVGSGNVQITATLTAADGREMTQPVSVKIALKVTANEGYTATAVEPAKLVKADQLETGVAYVITEKNTGAALTGRVITGADGDYKGLNGLCGLKTDGSFDLNKASVWYYDGTHLLYGTSVGTDNYLVYNGSGQVALGKVSEANIFDSINLYSADNRTFTLRSSKVAATTDACYLNQMGGSGYNVVGLYKYASTSQWHFSRLVEAKTVTLQITPTVNRLSVGQTVKLTAAVTVNGVQSSGYELTWASSDSAVATVTGGTVTARGSGSVILTATLTQIAGEPLSTPVTVSIPLTVAA